MMLDVGCGGSPIGDVNCDLMIPDSHQKWNLDPHGFRNFVRAAAEFLPFRDDVFDEVYSSHLLEHLDDPDLAVTEMLRVSRCRVKIILPFRGFSIFDFVFHRGKAFIRHLEWLEKHHKRSYWGRPLKLGVSRLKFINLTAALLRREKVCRGWLRIPIPFETETEITKHD